MTSILQKPKENIQVDCRFLKTGGPPQPQLVWLPDGRAYPVLQPLEIRKLDSMDCGHTGYQITVRIKIGRQDLFYDDRGCRWYVLT